VTPRSRDESLYLHDVVDAIDRIVAYTAEGRQVFLEDRKTQDAVVRNLEVIGEAAGKVDPRTSEAHPEIPWRDIVAVRNRIAHEYFTIDLDVVWDIVSRDLPVLRVQVAEILSTS
jgi:uncharacterized protein with HEPN domain